MPDFRVLGTLEVSDDRGHLLDVGGPLQRSVLALLALEVGRVVSMDRAIDELWPQEPPPRATASLQAYVSRIRRLLEPDRDPRTPSTLVRSRPPGWLLDVPEGCVDWVRFDRGAAHGADLIRDGEPDSARMVLGQALAQWRGPVLAELPDSAFARAARVRLTERRLTATEDWAEAVLLTGDATMAAAELEALVVDEPYRERLWRLLMLAHYRAGRQADALAAYGRARALLDRELGIEPSRSLRELHESVLRQDPALDLAAPLDCREVVSVRPATPSAAPPAVHLVGRVEALAVLDAALQGLAEGRGGFVLVTGDPGIGKTAVLTETIQRAAGHGVPAVLGSCVEGSPAPLLWPWLGVWRGLVNRLGGAAVASAFAAHGNLPGSLDPSLAELVPLPAPPPLPDAELNRTRLLAGFADALRSLARSAGLVVVLDDVQWLDRASEQLLASLVPGLPTVPLLVVAGQRSDPLAGDRPTSAALDALLAGPASRVLRLEGLDRNAVAEYVGSISGAAVRAEVVDALLDRSGGNPFFLGELVRMLVAERALDSLAGVGEAMPDRVQQVVRRRLARLPDQTNAVLTAAAVVGREFDLDVLGLALQLERAEMLDVLEPAWLAGLLGEVPGAPGRLRFAHDLVRQTVYEGASGYGRARIHGSVAAVVEQTTGDAAVLAHHARMAAPAMGVAWAVPLLQRAAEGLGRHWAPEDAEEVLQSALQLVGSLPHGGQRDAFEVSVRVRLGLLLQMVHGYNAVQASEQFVAAGQLLPGLPAGPESALHLVSCAAGLLSVGRAQQALDLVDELGSHGGPPLQLAARHVRTMVWWAQGRVAETLDGARETVALAQVCDPEGFPIIEWDFEVGARIFAAAAHARLGDEVAAERELVAAAARADTLGREFIRLSVGLAGLRIAVLRHDLDSAEMLARAVLEPAQRRGYGEYVDTARVALGWVRALRGETEGAAAAVEVATAGPQPGSLTINQLMAAEACVASGDADRGLAVVDALAAGAEATGELLLMPDLQLVRAQALAFLGRADEAAAAAEAGRDLAVKRGHLVVAQRITSWLEGVGALG